MKAKVIATPYLNIRRNPRTSALWVGRLYPETIVEIESEEIEGDDFIWRKIKGEEQYIAQENLHGSRTFLEIMPDSTLKITLKSSLPIYRLIEVAKYILLEDGIVTNSEENAVIMLYQGNSPEESQPLISYNPELIEIEISS